jgi:cell division protein FtsB
MITKMKKNEKRFKKIKHWISLIASFLAGVLLVVFISWLIIGNLTMIKRRGDLQERIESLKEEIKELEKRKSYFQAQISQIEDEEYLEEVAKNELDLRKEGETVIDFVLEEEPEEEEKKGEDSSFFNVFSSRESIFQKIFRSVKRIFSFNVANI